MSKPKEPLEIDFTVLHFYDKVRELLADAGRYAHSYKLRENLNDKATRFKVEHVFCKYYDGNTRKLYSEIHHRRCQCLAVISEISRMCEIMGIYPIEDKEALTELLLDERRRDGWQKLIKKHQKNNEVVSLQALELEYRKVNKAL